MKTNNATSRPENTLEKLNRVFASKKSIEPAKTHFVANQNDLDSNASEPVDFSAYQQAQNVI